MSPGVPQPVPGPPSSTCYKNIIFLCVSAVMVLFPYTAGAGDRLMYALLFHAASTVRCDSHSMEPKPCHWLALSLPHLPTSSVVFHCCRMAWLVSFLPYACPSFLELLRSASWFLGHLIFNSFSPYSTSARTSLSHELFIWGYSLRHPSLKITSIFLSCCICDFHYTYSGTSRPVTWAFLGFSHPTQQPFL